MLIAFLTHILFVQLAFYSAQSLFHRIRGLKDGHILQP